MRNKLFLRTFLALVAVISVVILALSLTMVTLVRAERTQSLENELRLQARDVAQLLQSRDSLGLLWRSDPTLSAAVSAKISDINASYGADVWLVNSAGYMVVLGENQPEATLLNDEYVIEQINRVLRGDEIRVTGLFDALGRDMVTFGVPWLSTDGRVLGAVLLHIGAARLAVEYSDIVRYAVVAGMVAMALGVAVSLLVARRQAHPLRLVTEAVADFGAGAFDRRLSLKGDDEIALLASTFNGMADKLMNLEESRRSFVASVSHELRSPMTSISGYVQGMLDGTVPPDEQNKYLQVVLDETRRLTKLVNELLDLSRIESGTFPLAVSVFDVNELILSALFPYEKRIEDKHITVEITFRDPKCLVEADQERIRQVVTNLIDNAVKYMDDGGELTVWTHTVDTTCYVTVRDNGGGISASDLPYIFDRFYKVDKAHTVGLGTGLGLSIVKKILEQHGQSISVNSSATGSEFVFTLKRAETAPPLPPEKGEARG